MAGGRHGARGARDGGWEVEWRDEVVGLEIAERGKANLHMPRCKSDAPIRDPEARVSAG